MRIELSARGKIREKTLTLSGSKSETNRLLLLQALFPQITLENASDSDDAAAMKDAIASKENIIDIKHAGTAMRFLTAYFASCEGREVILTGSSRMKQRPIKILVDALRQLGAKIEYLENDGFPPLKIYGRELSSNELRLDAGISSQYITALLLIAPRLCGGIEVSFTGEITSRPYIEMTLSLLKRIGVKTSFEDKIIVEKVVPADIHPQIITVESDWSSASYFYSMIALSDPGSSVTLRHFRKNSLQGDSAISLIYENFGVRTHFGSEAITLTKHEIELSEIDLDLADTPDIAQTIAVTAFGLGVKCTLGRLHTLKIKETDRIEALKNELEKLGAEVSATHDQIEVIPLRLNSNTIINTYDDHRMAMAFAPLALRVPISIDDAGVVSKSYPAFWDDLEKLGFGLRRL